MLTLTDVKKGFPGVFEPVLKGINFNLKKGDFCILIGANGSGKSTLLKTISGEYKIDHGNISLDNQDIIKSHQFISSVIQDVNKGTISEMTLLENLALSYMHTKSPRFKFYYRYENKAKKLLRELNLGLEDYLNKPLMNLSGGQRQVVATIMAFISKPKLLLLDEHTSALDPKMQKQLMHYTTKIIEDNKLTSIMITHKLDDAIKYGNRLIMLHRGKIVLDANNKKKSSLTVEHLLSLFHKYEDLELTSKRKNEF